MSYGGAQQPEDSPNYGGNLEVLPPHTDPTGASWPFGRLYHGGGDQGLIDGTAVSRHMNSNETSLLEAQGMQGPFVEISTEWLDVGHVDEISMVVADPSNTNNRPWKLLWASPTLAVSALAQLQTAGQGSAVIFDGRPEQTTVDAVLGNATLMSFNDGVQARLDSDKALLEQTVGLTDADFIEVPVLYETITSSGLDYGVAMSPGVQNCIPVDTTLYVPDPNGPQSNGQDVWEAQVLAAVTPLGLTVTFVDVYTSYHELLGEAHCGTNVRYQPYTLPWWNR
jgi:protein-arginine deiminase